MSHETSSELAAGGSAADATLPPPGLPSTAEAVQPEERSAATGASMEGTIFGHPPSRIAQTLPAATAAATTAGPEVLRREAAGAHRRSPAPWPLATGLVPNLDAQAEADTGTHGRMSAGEVEEVAGLPGCNLEQAKKEENVANGPT